MVIWSVHMSVNVLIFLPWYWPAGLQHLMVSHEHCGVQTKSFSRHVPIWVQWYLFFLLSVTSRSLILSHEQWFFLSWGHLWYSGSAQVQGFSALTLWQNHKENNSYWKIYPKCHQPLLSQTWLLSITLVDAWNILFRSS